MSSTFTLTVEEFPLITDLGFEALQVLQFDAVIEYGPTVDDGWFIASLWTEGTKTIRRGLDDCFAYEKLHGTREGFQWSVTERKKIEIERGGSLWQMITDRLESRGHWHEWVNDKVMERFAEDRECEAGNIADYRRDQRISAELNA
jgi:hypothetical protein